MASWKEDKELELSKLLDFVVDNRGKNPPLSNDEYPVIEGNALTLNDRFPQYEKVRKFVSKDTYETWFRKGHPKVNDLLFVTVGGIGTVALMDATQACIAQNIIALRFKKDYDSRFYYYYFSQKQMQEFFQSLDISSVQPSIKVPHLLETKVPILALSQQQAIAEVLSSLDDKIDLFRRQNKTLEEMAETLFRHWFVEKVEESRERGRVEDLFTLQRGFDLPTQDRVDGSYPIISASGINGYHSEFNVKGPGVTTGRSGLIGKVFYVDEDYWALNTSLFVSKFKIASPIYSYFFLKTLDLEQLNGGSAVPTLNRNDVHSIEALIPTSSAVKYFDELALPFFEKIKSNTKQIRILTKLRDTLLPKLMSGDEVRVNY
jgi:type I restriction enzyme S subunit